MRKLLSRPLFFRMPIHAYTRIRNDVQNGSITRHHQQIARRRIRARDVVRHRIADQQTQHGRYRRHHQRIHIGREVQAVGAAGTRSATRSSAIVQHALRRTSTISRVRRNAEARIGEADLHDQQERHEEKQQQPDERHRRSRPCGPSISMRRHGHAVTECERALHAVSTTPADALQRTYTSSSQVGGSISPSARLDTFATTVLPLSSFT